MKVQDPVHILFRLGNIGSAPLCETGSIFDFMGSPIAGALRGAAFAALLLFGPASSSTAQITYASAGFGFSSTSYKESQKAWRSTFSELNFQVQGLYRPGHQLGFGLVASVPFTSEKDLGFTWSGGDKLDVYKADLAYDRYNPDRWSYTIAHRPSLAAIVRFFAKGNANFYFDARAMFTSVEETFEFHRSAKPFYSDGFDYYGEVEALDISEKNSYSVFAPGLFAGMSPHLKNNMFIDISAGLYLKQFGSSAFSHFVQRRWTQDSLDFAAYQLLSSGCSGSKTSFARSIRLGRHF